MKKWILRLLTVSVVIIGLALLSLNVLSGTSDTQKSGLEQAFSGIFKGKAHFGKLTSFNLFPQLIIDVEDLTISDMAGGSIAAEEATMSFALMDIIMKNRLIENLHFKKLRIDEGVYLPLALMLDDAGTYAGDTAENGKFTFKGTYGDKDFEGYFDMLAKVGSPNKYTFRDENAFVMNVGAVQISGVFAPYVAKGGEVKDLKVFAAKKGGQQDCKVASDLVLSGSDFFHDVIADFANIKGAADFDAACRKLSRPATSAP